MWSIRPSTRCSLRSGEWIPRLGTALGLLLGAEDLAQGGHAHLELLRGRLLGRHQPLYLVTGPVEGAGRGGVGVSLAPREHLGGQRRTRDADGGASHGP